MSNKIIQIVVNNDNLFALDEDGNIYVAPTNKTLNNKIGWYDVKQPILKESEKNENIGE